MRIFFIIIFLFSVSAYSKVRLWESTLPKKTQFDVSEALEERVDFWVKIYSYYKTSQGVFHLVDDPSFILGEIDLSEIVENSVLSNAHRAFLIEKKIKEQRLRLLTKWKISDPKKIRLQMGLKDRMEQAFFLSGRYLPMMENIFKKKKLPVELTRIVFVESSFNIFAQSKVGASGLWQIMPAVAKPFGYINQNYDKRNHPAYATELASNILAQNYKALGSWPLAITAYNHGLTGVRRMANRNGTKRIEELIESNDKVQRWGFASQNFYACFLAVLEVEKNALHLFGKNLIQSKKLDYKEYELKKSISKNKILRLYNGSLARFRQMNPHLNWSRIMKFKKIPAGVPLLIPSENYHLVALTKS